MTHEIDNATLAGARAADAVNLESLARAANARSTDAGTERSLLSGGFMYSATDGWLSLTEKGRQALTNGGYSFDSKHGWIHPS